jgi:hypothetical protein
MLFQKLALFSAIAAIASAQDVDNNDVPQECRAICAPLIASTQQCDNQTSRGPVNSQFVSMLTP